MTERRTMLLHCLAYFKLVFWLRCNVLQVLCWHLSIPFAMYVRLCPYIMHQLAQCTVLCVQTFRTTLCVRCAHSASHYYHLLCNCVCVWWCDVVCVCACEFVRNARSAHIFYIIIMHFWQAGVCLLLHTNLPIYLLHNYFLFFFFAGFAVLFFFPSRSLSPPPPSIFLFLHLVAPSTNPFCLFRFNWDAKTCKVSSGMHCECTKVHLLLARHPFNT